MTQHYYLVAKNKAISLDQIHFWHAFISSSKCKLYAYSNQMIEVACPSFYHTDCPILWKQLLQKLQNLLQIDAKDVFCDSHKEQNMVRGTLYV